MADLTFDSRAFHRSLMQAAAVIARRVERNLGDVGERAVQEARRRVPVETGTLRDSIKSKQSGEDTVAVTAEAPYAAFVEFGTSNQPPRAFFRPALARAKQEAERILARGV